MIGLVAAMVMTVASEPLTICLTAARRMMMFIAEEARGTRHEAQIRSSTERVGGLEKAVVALAATLDLNQCTFIVAAPDSTLRALAISSLPERNGK